MTLASAALLNGFLCKTIIGIMAAEPDMFTLVEVRFCLEIVQVKFLTTKILM